MTHPYNDSCDECTRQRQQGTHPDHAGRAEHIMAAITVEDLAAFQQAARNTRDIPGLTFDRVEAGLHEVLRRLAKRGVIR